MFKKGILKLIFVIAVSLYAAKIFADDWQDSPAIGKLFADAGLSGTFVLYDSDANRLVGHDRVRAETRFVPASTFKIPHTLIGLSVGAVKSVDELLPYGGQRQPFEVWEHDMGLREAIKISNVPIYQELARRIGIERMRDELTRVGFGNVEIGDTVDDFWLLGPLKISAVEQAIFQIRLARGELPVSKEIQASVREIIKMESSGDWTLYGKTGWLNAPNPGLGWWVGWVEKQNRLYGFALNLDIGKANDAAKRIELGKASLRALGIL